MRSCRISSPTEIRPALPCWPGPWVPYMRPLLSTEVPWDDLLPYALQRFLDLWVYASFMRLGGSLSSRASHRRSFDLEKPLSPWPPHRIRWLEGSLWPWPPHRMSSSIPNQPALKTWKPPSWVTQKKHGLVAPLPAASSIESLTSYNPQPPVLVTDSWLSGRETESESFFSSLSPYSICRIDELLGGMIKRDRVGYTRLRKPRRFSCLHLTSSSTIILIAQLDRAVASGDVSDTVQLSMRRKP